MANSTPHFNPFDSNYICPTCEQTVEDDASASNTLGCDGACHRWFHRRCVNLSLADFQDISAMDDITWICPSCRMDIQSAPAIQNQSVDATEIQPERQLKYPEFIPSYSSPYSITTKSGKALR